MLGNAIAATKWRWKAGSIAVSIFSILLTTPSISARDGEVEQGDAGAGSRSVAGARDLGEVAVGDEAERHRIKGVDVAAEGAGEGDALGRGAGALDEQLGAGVERGLGELDRAHVGLVDEEPRRPSRST